MSKRRPLSPMRRLALFERASGQCHICERKIASGEKWEVEHIRPLALLGADDESNMAPAHVKCHATKTKADAASWSKAKRIRAKHVGAHRSSRPMAGGKASGWRRRMDGTVEKRT